MFLHTKKLRELCANNQEKIAPFVIRTRFERELYGLLVTLSRLFFDDQPSSIDRQHVLDFLKRQPASREDVYNLLLEISRIFHKFTYLCDTSNWSNDGQDPRVEACRPEIILLCDRIESLHKSAT